MTRIAWFHPRPWGPAQGGGDLRTWGLVEGALAHGHEVLLVVPGDTRPTQVPPGLELLSIRQPGMLALPPAKVFSRHPLRSPRLGVRHRELRERLGTFRPDVAVVSEVMAWALARDLLPDGLPLAYDCANVETVLFRELRDNAVSWFDRVTLAVDARRVARAEEELLGRASTVLTVSEADAAALRERSGRAAVTVVASSVRDPGMSVDVARNAPTMLFVGTLDYAPNTEAIFELIDEIGPEVRRSVPDARLRVVGRRAPAALRRRVEGTEWVDLVEDASDLRPHYAIARCVVLPIRSGGGTKLKVYEAMSYGMPVVATDAAVAGIPVTDRHDVLIAEEGSSLAELAQDVLVDDDLARGLGGAARATFVDRLAWDAGPVEQLDQVLRALAR